MAGADSLAFVVAAFAGGAFGAAIGALPAFAFTGFLVIAGEVVNVVEATTGTEALAAVDITNGVAFGPAFGPHVAFAGGAAAIAYATKLGIVEVDSAYHPAKEITTGVSSRPDVLAVGGVFGVVGHLVAVGAGAASLPLDPVALGVVGSALAHRIALGYSLVGAHPRHWFDMSPYERESGGRSDEHSGDETAADGGRRVEPWLPYQYRWSHVAALGVTVGALGAYVAYRTASPFLAFGMSAASLLFIVAGVERIPVTHHITLPASTVVLAAIPGAAEGLGPAAVESAFPLWGALALGAVMGLVGALLGEVTQRIFYAHAETHLDPPAASIVLTSLLLGVLALAGVLPSPVWIPLL